MNLNTPAGLGIQNLTILGGGSFGSGDVGPTYPPAASAVGGLGASVEIVGSGRFPLMTFGAFGASNVNGLSIINIGFRDTALNPPGATAASTSAIPGAGCAL